MRDNIGRILNAIAPVIEHVECITKEKNRDDFDLAFAHNYDALRAIVKKSIFRNPEIDSSKLDRHKIASIVILSVLSISKFSRKIPNGNDNYNNLDELIKLYPTEILAWHSGLTILLNYVIDERNILPIYTFSRSYPFVNREIFGEWPTTLHDSCEQKTYYLYSIVKLLTYYRYYSDFTVVACLSVSHILFGYELRIQKILDSACASGAVMSPN